MYEGADGRDFLTRGYTEAWTTQTDTDQTDTQTDLPFVAAEDQET